MSDGIFLLPMFNQNKNFKHNKKLTKIMVYSIIKLNEDTRVNITKQYLYNYIKSNYIKSLDYTLFIIVYNDLKKTFKIKNSDKDYHETEDLYFPLRNLFPILKTLHQK